MRGVGIIFIYGLVTGKQGSPVRGTGFLEGRVSLNPGKGNIS